MAVLVLDPVLVVHTRDQQNQSLGLSLWDIAIGTLPLGNWPRPLIETRIPRRCPRAGVRARPRISARSKWVQTVNSRRPAESSHDPSMHAPRERGASDGKQAIRACGAGPEHGPGNLLLALTRCVGVRLVVVSPSQRPRTCGQRWERVHRSSTLSTTCVHQIFVAKCADPTDRSQIVEQ